MPVNPRGAWNPNVSPPFFTQQCDFYTMIPFFPTSDGGVGHLQKNEPKMHLALILL